MRSCIAVPTRPDRGRNELRPYEDDAMNVVRHHHGPIDGHARMERRNLVPHRLRNPPGSVQPHRAVHNLTEDTHPVVRADGDEIRPVARIVETRQSHRTAARPVAVKRLGHHVASHVRRHSS